MVGEPIVGTRSCFSGLWPSADMPHGSALRRRWQPVGDEGLSSQILLSRYCNAFLPATAILCGRRGDRVHRRSDLAIPVPPGPSMGGAWFRGGGDRVRAPRATSVHLRSIPATLDLRSSEMAQSMTLLLAILLSRMRESKMRARILNIIRERDDDHRNVRD